MSSGTPCTWIPLERLKGDDIVDPISGEFFAEGKLDLATALVRESLQNALDAGRNGEAGRDRKPVRVRLAVFSGQDIALDAWFRSLNQHILAPRSGISNPPQPGEPFRFVVIEDFRTTGLTGDFNAPSSLDVQNNFVDFLRSDGRTRKEAGNQGSWGVGKSVFPRSSRINAFIAFTVRHDDRLALLMGKAIFRHREIDGTLYQPPCYMATAWDHDQPPAPIEDRKTIDIFQQTFRVERTHDKPGLSVVVPWAHDEITFDAVRNAVLREYAYAILCGGLEVDLERDETPPVRLNAANILEQCEGVEGCAYLPLADWARRIADGDRIVLPSPPAKEPQKWSQNLVSAEVAQTINERLNRGDRVAVRVQLHVRPKGKDPTSTHFDLYLDPNDAPTIEKPHFFREQLSISGVQRAKGVAGIRSLVVVDHKPLADLLRAAEPPNHTDWSAQTANFKAAYLNGSPVLTFVRSSTDELMRLVRSSDNKPDPTLAAEFFSLPEVHPDRRAKASAKGGKAARAGDQPPTPPEDIPPPAPKPFRIQQIDGGFHISRDNPDVPCPERINVSVAYDVDSGSPWSQHDPLDFDFAAPSKAGLQIIQGGAVRDIRPFDKAHRFQIVLAEPNACFDIYVTGFDPNRDLIVHARAVKEKSDGDSETELHESEEADA